MGPGNEGGGEFAVEEPEPGVYNPTGAEPPVWQPSPQDILLMFDQLEKDQVLPLKWVCPGRRPPESEAPEQPMNDISDGDGENEDKEEEKRAPEPSAFDFDDTASEVSAKVTITPRTPAQAKRPEKKVACMDNIISSLKRQQKAEREARKNQARSLGMTGPFRSGGGGGGTPSRVGVGGFSPSTSPRVLSASASPGSGSPRGSPRVSAPSTPPSFSSSRLAPDGGESSREKKAEGGGSGGGGGGGEEDCTSTPVAGSPTTTAGGPSEGGADSADREVSQGAVCEAPASEVVGSSSSGTTTTTTTIAAAAVAVAGPAPSSYSSSVPGLEVGVGVSAMVKVEPQDSGEGGETGPGDMEVNPSDSDVVVKQEG